MIALYTYGVRPGGDAWFGIDALRVLGEATFAAGVVLCIGAAIALALANPSFRSPGHATAAVTAVFSFPVFFLLRTHVLNPDGAMFARKFEADVPRVGAHLTHDEVLELFLHSRVWYYTHQWWGWSVVFSYQVVSCLAGALFVYGLLRLAPRLAPARTWLFLIGAVSGGYMQLFFGDVENYTVSAAIVVFYVLAAHRYLSGEVGLHVPSAILAVAMCFHLETGWLLPSWLYLAWVERSRPGSNAVARSAALGLAIGAATLAYFHFHGLPIWRLHSSQTGLAFRMQVVFAVGMPLEYYLDQLNLLLLLCPAVALAVPLFVWHRHERDRFAVFLAIAAASMVSMQVVWKAQLGVREDWNLYAIGGMLATFAIWRAAASAAVTVPLRFISAGIAAVACFHTYAWILSNHRYQ